jgi:hypothetical protein
MDISEYELLKENKKLLEQSLQSERKLKDEITKLNNEKIKDKGIRFSKYFGDKVKVYESRINGNE